MKKQELNYYDEFIKNVDFALQISNILKDYSNHFDYSHSEEIEQQVHKLENSADQSLHNILNYLIKDFLPPIEREDIIMLANNIDDLVDNIDEIAINLNILNVITLRNDFAEFTNLIYKTIFTLKDLMLKFKNFKKYDELKSIVVDINHLEDTGDKLYQDAIKNLYQFEQNPIEVSKWHTIYNSLENCFDSCEIVATCIDEIIMKNS